MRLLPIAERELRVGSRRRATYWVRFAAAAAGIAATAILFVAARRVPPTEQGRVLFSVLSVFAFAYCLLCGVTATSDCVSEEKREGTLGLLFLTDLRGYDVVLGKLVAHSVRAVSGLAALIPIIALPVLLGGVSGELVWAVAAVLMNTMFLSLACGVLVSTIARDVRAAVGGTLLLLVGLVALLPLVHWLAFEYLGAAGPAANPRATAGGWTWWLVVNPVVLFAGTLESLVRGGTANASYWTGLGVQHALAWLALALACVLLPRSWQDRAQPERRRANPAGPRAARERRARTDVLDLHPFAWIITRDRRPTVYSWLGLAAVGGVWLWGYAEVRQEWLQGVVAAFTVFAAGVWLKVRLASVACRPLWEHRRTGALELLLSTPVTPEGVVRGAMLGLRLTMLPPLATVLAGAGLLLAAALGQERGLPGAGDWVWTFLLGLGVLVLDLWAIAWAGLWRGLAVGRYVQAYASTVGAVLFLPWILFALSLIVAGLATELFNLSWNLDLGYAGVLGWWTAVAVAVDVGLVVRARDGLRRRFRDLAADAHGRGRPAPAPPAGDGKPL